MQAASASSALAALGHHAEEGLGAAAAWTHLANAFHAASERDEPEPALWRQIDTAANEVATAEERLWTSLANP